MFGAGQAKFTCSAALLMSVQPILMTLSKNVAGGFDYSVLLSTMLSELLKLGISLVLLVRSRIVDPSRPLLSDEAVKEFFSFMLPGLIYFVNNNCLFFILQAVDPTTFQLLSQMKTIFTGLLFRVCLGRHLSGVQYLALVTLACGTATSQIPSGAATGHASLVGFLLSLVSSMLSALGGIYSEKLLKGRPSASIHWQNIQLYTWGILFNAVGVFMRDRRRLASHSVLTGYEFWAWSVVLCNALNGLAISAVLKYADSVARVYAHAS